MRWTIITILLFMTGCHKRAAANHRDFVDMAGRRVAVPASVRRVVTAGALPAVNAILLVLGKKDSIQNGLPKQLHSARWRFQEKLNPAIVRRPVVSSMGPAWTPDYELLAGLTYDVVVVDSPATATAMARRGIPAVVLKWAGAESIKNAVSTIGRLTGTEQRANAYRQYHEKLLARVKARLAGVSSSPSALYIRLDNFTLPIIGNSSEIVQRAGGTYAVEPSKLPDHATFSHEQLLVWDPEVLFVWAPSEVARVSRDLRLKELRAVKTRRVYAVPMGAHLWFHYTPEQPLGVLWAAHVLHPEIFSEDEVEREVRSFYRRFFDYALGKEELAAILMGLP